MLHTQRQKPIRQRGESRLHNPQSLEILPEPPHSPWVCWHFEVQAVKWKMVDVGYQRQEGENENLLVICGLHQIFPGASSSRLIIGMYFLGGVHVNTSTWYM